MTFDLIVIGAGHAGCEAAMTAARLGLATLLLLAARDEIDVGSTLRVIAAVALVSALLPAFFTRGRHLSWVVFLAVAGLLFAAQP